MRAPLVAAIQRYTSLRPYRFHVPGHKGKWIPGEARCLGRALFLADVTELDEIGDLTASPGVENSPLEEAQGLAATAFGAKRTWFLVGGSTRGIQAAVLATCGPGQRLIIPRNVHYSAVSGIVLSGAMPVWLVPPVVPELGVAGVVEPQQVREALSRDTKASAVLVPYPTYYGLAADLPGIAGECRRLGTPLIVDQAHGAHFGWHPALPPSALALGADIVVQSPHKTLCSLTQTGLLHLSTGARVNADRIQSALTVLESSSPSFPLLASIDAMRAEMVERGRAVLARAVGLAQRARRLLNRIKGARCYGDELEGTGGVARTDPLRLVISLTAAGVGGRELMRELATATPPVRAEMWDLNNVVCVLTPGDSARAAEHLVRTVRRAARSLGVRSCTLPAAMPPQSDLPRQILAPREAFFRPYRWVRLEEARSMISWGLVAPYPPGQVALCPGEQISAEVVEYLRQWRDAGASFHGSYDPHTDVIAVVKE